MTTLKVNVIRKPTLKVKTLVKFPANVVTQNFLTVVNSGGTYTFSIDYTKLGPGPIIDPTTAFVAVLDTTSGTYKEVALSSLLTSGLDADLQAIAALTGTGILTRTAANTWAVRTETGTANEITVTNGDGVAGNPTYSLPSALTFTGKTVTGGTYASAVTFNKVTITAPATAATLTLIDGTTLTGPAASGTVMTLGNTETVTGVKTFGSAGAVGRFKLAGTTSGTTVLDATAIASGTITLPAATDTLIGKATTDILTNKTYDTAGAGNSFSINSLAATANTGTGAVVRATSPALVTPALGTPTALVLTSATGLPLSGLTTQAAFTFVGNNTSGAAVPTAVDIHALTLKASPAGTDEVIISDQAASGAWKRAPVSSLASASGVSSIAGNTGAFTLSTGITNSTNDIRLDTSLFKGQLFGLTLSTSGGSATFGIAVGFVADSTAVDFMKLTSAFTKTTGAWSLGSGGGSLDTGSIAATTWYHVFIIKRPDTGVVDVLTSLSATAPTMPTNYTLFRRIGAMRTIAGVVWVQFSQIGDQFYWTAAKPDAASLSVGTSRVLITLTAPPSTRAFVKTLGFNASSVTSFVLQPTAETDAAPGVAGFTIASEVTNGGTGAPFELPVDSSSQIAARAANASGVLNVWTWGWEDSRGRLF